MKICISTNKFHATVRAIKALLKKDGHEIQIPLAGKDADIFDASLAVANAVASGKADRGIIIDEFGSGGFMIATKIPGTIVAQLDDEHSAHMTRAHNNTNIITVGATLNAQPQLLTIIKRYIDADFEGGRHLVRTDMLDEMLKGEK